MVQNLDQGSEAQEIFSCVFAWRLIQDLRSKNRYASTLLRILPRILRHCYFWVYCFCLRLFFYRL